MRAPLLIALAVSATAHGDPCTADEPGIEAASPPHDTFTLTKAQFKDLPGWSDDKLSEALPAFLKSCVKLAELKDDEPVGVDGHGGFARQWRHACAEAARVKAGEPAARAFFEGEFVPYVASGKAGATGKLTGFDVQSMHASRTKHGAFTIPVLGRPSDLVMVDLGTFVHDGHGRHLWGRLDKAGELEPFYTRSEIRKGALAAEKLEILYADDPVDVLFAQIEGSARAKLDDGTEVWLEFAGKNGRSYLGVGGLLKQKGELKAPGSGTMQGIRQWFKEHAGRFDEIVDGDASYVFFKESKEPGAVGSQKVILTPRRSLAVDRAFIAMSTPVFVDTKAPVVGKPGVVEPWDHLVIAQDTGAGIIGAVRGDVYWGADRDAEELGGRMGGSGRYWVLLPRGVSK